MDCDKCEITSLRIALYMTTYDCTIFLREGTPTYISFFNHYDFFEKSFTYPSRCTIVDHPSTTKRKKKHLNTCDSREIVYLNSKENGVEKDQIYSRFELKAYYKCVNYMVTSLARVSLITMYHLGGPPSHMRDTTTHTTNKTALLEAKTTTSRCVLFPRE